MNSHLNILLVEDNPDHAELVLRSLHEHRAGNEIFHVTDGLAALDYLLRRNDFTDPASSPRPDVIFLDLRLPKVDGLEVLRKVKTDTTLHRIPVVVLTTSEAERDVVQAYDLGANSYLVKPIAFDRFENMMRDLSFYWLAWNQAPSM